MGQVQRCFTGKDRVCDTTYDIDTTTKDDYQCCNVETPNCFMEEKTINDVTCTNTVEFDCQREKSTKNDGYGQKQVVCKRTPKQDCYNIPRSKSRSARLIFTGIVRSFRMCSPSLWRSRTVTSNPRRSASLRLKLVPRKRRSTAIRRIARSNQGRSVTNARRNPSSHCVTCRRG